MKWIETLLIGDQLTGSNEEAGNGEREVKDLNFQQNKRIT